MIWLLCGICAALVTAMIILLCKVATLRRAAGEIGAAFSARLDEDTNVGIDVSTADRRMRRLAADMDKHLKHLRHKHIRFTQGDRELKDAVTNIAHDLRTPLTAICGYLELLEQEEVPENARKYLQIIANRTDAMKQLTEELFRYSVIVSAADDNREAVMMNRVLEECIATHYGALTERGIVPEVTLSETPVERLLNRAAISRILDNIMSNALKYSDGDLSVSLLPDGTISFRNHAKDLDEISTGRLFDRFYTVENGRGGTGLGLSIAKILTEQMGGTIQACKDGDIFIIELIF